MAARKTVHVEMPNKAAITKIRKNTKKNFFDVLFLC